MSLTQAKPSSMLFVLGAIVAALLLLLPKSQQLPFNAENYLRTECSNHQYTVEIISQDPLVIYINSFMSEEEITWLLKKGEFRYERMLTYQGDSLSDAAFADEGRTSSSAYIEKTDPVMTCIGNRALEFHGGSQRILGDYGNPQLVKYEPNQKVNLHYDWWLEPQNRWEGFAIPTKARQRGVLGEFAGEWDGRREDFTFFVTCRRREKGGNELLATSVFSKLVKLEDKMEFVWQIRHLKHDKRSAEDLTHDESTG
ncbi:hypothetical protein TSTA_126500 [Talaromyces stipitatus ATCC 10500]|uniref:Uncharacterized protein n=1 Tax=Talaromyces stipitatus (strain ATCC 10500 / CBS 375.48 / QM 6759 / NRRL 1006) TaxID=441959 RepID=B8MCP0_TALSN|nr:uncharacterized protein TSTA_126500 [Talaromyces stipitatus ATCC 10500]EED18942.1 hypothetical protein TSTA_126500 [Talaromyces stipitatus ATCC 10500]